MLTREVSHYYQLKDHGIPVADYYNMDELETNKEFHALIQNRNEKPERHFRSRKSHAQLKKFLSQYVTSGFYRAEYIPEPFFTLEELHAIRIDEEFFEEINHPLINFPSATTYSASKAVEIYV